GVHCFFNNMKTSATLKNIHIAVVGEKTNLALMQYGRTADFIPSTYNARTMANEFLKRYTVTGRMLLVRGSKARPELVDAFSNANKVFDLLEVYKTEKNDAAKGKLNWIFERVVPDYITFTSPFAVTAFNDLFQMSLTTEPVVVCIGTTTAFEAEKKGWNHIIVPETYTTRKVRIKMQLPYFKSQRRLRSSVEMRSLVRETKLSVDDLIYPLFIIEGEGIKQEVPSMPGVYQISLDYIEKEANEIVSLGIKSVLLFGVPKEKDEEGTGAYASNGIVQEATRVFKKVAPGLLIVADTCLCEYTSHGHCGV